MNRIFLSTCFLLMLFAGCYNQEGFSVIKFRRVVRLPNSLEYSDQPFTKREKELAAIFFKRENTFFLVDTTGDIYLPKKGSYGDGIKTYFWVMSDLIADSISKDLK